MTERKRNRKREKRGLRKAKSEEDKRRTRKTKEEQRGSVWCVGGE